MNLQLRAAVAALTVGLSAAAASAQPVPAPLPEPKVIRYPGGAVVLSGSDVVVRQKAPAGHSTTVVKGVGNGVGNRVVVDGGPGGVTVVSGSRIGVGNTLAVNPDDLLFDLDEWLLPPAARPAAPLCYKGKANAFWDQKVFSDAHDCNLYWCPKAKKWFRYHADDDAYRPVADQPAAPVQPVPPNAPDVMPR